MSNKKVVHVRGMLRSVSSQRLQYKPYGYELCFDESMGEIAKDVVVEFDIPADVVLEETQDYIVVGLDGLNAILEVTADSLDKLDAAYKKKIQGG